MPTTVNPPTPRQESYYLALLAERGYDPQAEVRRLADAGRYTRSVISGEIDRLRTEPRVVHSAPPIPDPPEGVHVYGTDRIGEPNVYRVRPARSSGRLYAQRQNRTALTATGRATWDYEGRRPLRNLSAETLITEEQARDIGARFGFCANCGRTLTADASIERGIGPVCWRRIQANRIGIVPAGCEDLEAELRARIDRARQAAVARDAFEFDAVDADELAELEDDNSDPEDDRQLVNA